MPPILPAVVLLILALAACTPGLDEPPRGASEALIALHQAATTPEDQYQLGMAYSVGLHGAPHDEARALFWIERAAQQGYAPAQYELGAYYTLPGTEDDDQARLWFLLAAEQGFPPAQAALGLLYATLIGEGTADGIEAYAWLQLSAEGGEAVEQALHQVIEHLTLDEFTAARRRYQELVQGRGRTFTPAAVGRARRLIRGQRRGSTCS